MVVRFGAVLALLFALSSLSLVAAPSGGAIASSGFLTLPFPSDPAMHLQQGWRYTWDNSLHLGGGIDYIKGSIDNSATWQAFSVLAAAEGDAEWVSVADKPQQGNYVFITHNIGGQTYYTYYGHLASAAAGIPRRGSGLPKKHVLQGDVIGTAGNTGTWSNGYLHLHFSLQNSAGQSIDPYGLNKQRAAYPQPNDQGGTCGANSYWISCPPRSPGALCPNPIPNANQVVLFEEPSFGGRCVVKDFGLYPNANAIGLTDNAISSMRLGENAVIGLYDRTDYIEPATYQYGPRDIATLGTFDNRASSARVSNNAVVFKVVRTGTSTPLANACWFIAKDGDWQHAFLYQCDAYRGLPDGVTPFGAATRGLLGVIPGNYRVREVSAPPGYNPVAEFSLTVVDGRTQTVTVQNSSLSGSQAAAKRKKRPAVALEDPSTQIGQGGAHGPTETKDRHKQKHKQKQHHDGKGKGQHRGRGAKAKHRDDRGRLPGLKQ